MKRSQFFLALSFLALSSQAQLGKGNMYLGGNVNFFQDNTSRQDSSSGFNSGEAVNKSNYFTGTINYGYFVRTNLAVGALFRYTYSDQVYRTDNMSGNNYWPKENVEKYHAYALGAFVRKYWPLGESMFAFYLQSSVSYGVGTNTRNQIFLDGNSGEYNHKNTSRKEEITTLKLTPGIVYFINKHFGAECSMGNFTYTMIKSRYFLEGLQTGNSNSSSLRANFSVSAFYIGLNYYFGRNM